MQLKKNYSAHKTRPKFSIAMWKTHCLLSQTIFFLNKWNHNLKPAFGVYLGCLCLTFKFIWAVITNMKLCDKYAKLIRNQKGWALFHSTAETFTRCMCWWWGTDQEISVQINQNLQCKSIFIDHEPEYNLTFHQIHITVWEERVILTAALKSEYTL